MSVPLFRALIFPLLLTGCLFAPGWLLGRALRTPAGITGSFLGSVALLFSLTLILDALGLRLSELNLFSGFAVLSAVLFVIPQFGRDAATPDKRADFAEDRKFPAPSSLRRFGWLSIPVIIGLAGITVRAVFEPLSGFDTAFRWDFLAQQMFYQGGLQYYPPVTSEDFTHYGWCDGIAPIISNLYLWSYHCLGHVSAGATTPVVLLQALLVFWIVGSLAARRGGPAAGATACALLATSAAFLWGVAMGQETGLTALTTVAMFWFIEKCRDQPEARWWIWAGLAAGTGALAREYGLVLLPLGALVLARRRAPPRHWMEFAITAAVIALPWYLRNMLKTGHPFYSLGMGGLFPANPIHLEYMRVVTEARGITANFAFAFPLLAELIALLAGVPMVVGFWVAFAQRRTFWPWLVAVLVFGGLWLASISQTSGGYTYSTRVLTPVIALLAVLGGIGLARLALARYAWLLALFLTVVALDAAARSLFLPIDTQPPWWRIRFFAWRDAGEREARWRSNTNWSAITEAADNRYILVSDPFIHAALVRCGAKPAPLFSPAVRFLFTASSSFEDQCARLRASGFRFILLSRDNSFLNAQLAPHAFFSDLKKNPPLAKTNAYFIYDLYPIELRTP
jgi:Dolichyl-phosphate-mannose-protein mannosyltransferase